MTAQTQTTFRSFAAVPAAIGFLLAFLAVGLVSEPLADRPLPMPGAPPVEVAAYYAANPLAASIGAALQVVSVGCFAVVVRCLTPVLRKAGRQAARLPWIGYLSVAAMTLSSLLSGALVLLASSAAPDTVGILRQAGFIAGGVVTVVFLGAFVLGASRVLGRLGVLGIFGRWFGFVAGTLAVLSVLSLVFFYASPLLPVGRLLSMIWTVIVAVQLVRRRSGS
jgi:hypothetical protein